MVNVQVKKQARKTLKFHNRNFGEIKPPYKVLFDAEMICGIALQKVPWKQQVEELLDKKAFIPMTTQAVLDYLRQFGDKFIEAVVVAKNFTRPKTSVPKKKEKSDKKKKVTIEEVYKSIFECLGEKNEQRYVMAVNDISLRYHIRKKYITVPIIRMDRTLMHFEPPTQKAQETAEAQQKSQFVKFNKVTSWEQQMLEALKQGKDVNVMDTMPVMASGSNTEDKQNNKRPRDEEDEDDDDSEEADNNDKAEEDDEEEEEATENNQQTEEGSEEEDNDEEDEEDEEVEEMKPQKKKQRVNV